MKNYCRLLLHELCFFYDAIGPCCSRTIENTPLKMPFDSRRIRNFNLDEYIKARNYQINLLKNNQEPVCYKDCLHYEESQEDQCQVMCLKNIVISNRTKCNCHCIYCEQAAAGPIDRRKELNTRQNYDIIPILKILKEQNLISDGCNFTISGGDLAIYPDKELKYLLNFAKSYNGFLLLLSSGIKYSKLIAEALKTGRVRITISVDAGSREIYEKIKRVKTFDNVWKTLQKYAQAAENNPTAEVEAKYIVVPGVNDSIEEVINFIERCKLANIRYIKAECEHFYMRENFNEPFNPQLKTVFAYFNNIMNSTDYFKHFTFEGVGKDWILEKLK